MATLLLHWNLLQIFCIVFLSNAVSSERTVDWMSHSNRMGIRSNQTINISPTTQAPTISPTTGQSYEPFVLSVPNSNDCSSAGPDYIIITNELDCEQAHDQLNDQGLVTFPGYQGPISDISIPLGCILGGEVYSNYDPIGSANIAYTPICKYLAPGTSEPPAPYKLASLNTEDCSSAGVDYRPITDNIECQTAAAFGFVGADFYYKDFCDVELYPDGCYLNNLNAGSVFYGNMTDGSADINSAPICSVAMSYLHTALFLYL